MLRNIGNLLVKCMQQVIKGHLNDMFEVSVIQVEGPVSFQTFCKGHKLNEKSLQIVLRIFAKDLWLEGGYFYISPYYFFILTK